MMNKKWYESSFCEAGSNVLVLYQNVNDVLKMTWRVSARLVSPGVLLI